METETKTLPTGVQVRTTESFAVVLTRTNGEHVLLRQRDLQEFVQYAYDVHGILASPSYALEAERATEPKPGGCPCGMGAACSDAQVSA